MRIKCQIEKPGNNDIEIVSELLEGAGLPYEDISEHWKTFLVAKVNGKIIGAIGLEILNDKALLRSLVVKNEFRNYGFGKELYNRCIELAKQNNIKEIGLLTTTAEGFFAKAGFEKVHKENIPPFIKSTKEFQVYCPSSSTIMIKTI